jgi:Cu/Ag efflux protein CusF
MASFQRALVTLQPEGLRVTQWGLSPRGRTKRILTEGSQSIEELTVRDCYATFRAILLVLMLLGICSLAGLQAAEWGPYESEGTVLGIMPDQGLILLDHEPIRAPGYLMGKMEMPFSVSDPALMHGLTIGDRVHFRVSEEKKSRILELRKLP